MCDAIQIAHPQLASDVKKFVASDSKTHQLDLKPQENASKTFCENCEIRWGFQNFQFQDDSDGGRCLPVSCRHPGLHDHCLDESLSLSLVDDSDDSSRDADAHGCFLSVVWDAAMSSPLSHDDDVTVMC